jgi:hypothetical protein
MFSLAIQTAGVIPRAPPSCTESSDGETYATSAQLVSRGRHFSYILPISAVIIGIVPIGLGLRVRVKVRVRD